MENEIKLKIQTQSYNAWLKPSSINQDKYEHWMLKFKHEISYNNKILINLVGKSTEEPDWMELACAELNPDKENQQIIMNTDGDWSYVIKALNRQYNDVNIINQKTEQWKDDDEDEIETNTTYKIDVTGLYYRYLEKEREKYMHSPITDIRIYIDSLPKNILRNENVLECKLKGTNIKLKTTKISNNYHVNKWPLEAKLQNHPQYSFLLQETAQKVFSDVIKKLQEAKQRTSAITIYKGNDGDYIRCKIDGEQQMGKKIYCSFDKDIEKHILAFLCYKQELEKERQQENALSPKR